MHYVYLIRSIDDPRRKYIGITEDLKKRMQIHNEGSSPHTKKYKPWELICYMGFKDKYTAYDFEKYLKSGSGQAFANKRLFKDKLRKNII